MGFVRDLDGVAEIPVEEVQANADRHLELVDEDEEEDVDPRVEALAQGHRRQRPRTDRDRRPRVEERIRDRHDLADDGNIRNAEDDDAEQTGRQRQVAGQLVLVVAMRPIAEERDDVGETEQDRLGGEQVRERA